MASFSFVQSHFWTQPKSQAQSISYTVYPAEIFEQCHLQLWKGCLYAIGLSLQFQHYFNLSQIVGGRHSTDVAFALLTQSAQVRFSASWELFSEFFSEKKLPRFNDSPIA